MKKSWIANGVTALNGLLGGLSIMFSFNGEFNLAAICILLAVVADAADGRTARALGTSSPLGVELDSLCDDISFGIGAGVLMYSYQLHDLGIIGMIICALLGTLCAFRLARFNVKSDVVHGYFEGLPCPTTGMIVATYVLSGVMVVCIILAWTTWAAAICAGYILFGMINTYMNRKRKSRRIIRRRKRSIEVHEEE